MRKTVVALFGVLFVLGACVSAQNVSMPNYSTWEKTEDHTEPYTYKGAKIELRDEHYEHLNPEETESSLVMVIYNPDTGKPWFAAYVRSNKNEDRSYLFDANQEGDWVFVRDITGSTEQETAELLRSRYGLVYGSQ